MRPRQLTSRRPLRPPATENTASRSRQKAHRPPFFCVRRKRKKRKKKKTCGTEKQTPTRQQVGVAVQATGGRGKEPGDAGLARRSATLPSPKRKNKEKGERDAASPLSTGGQPGNQKRGGGRVSQGSDARRGTSLETCYRVRARWPREKMPTFQ